LFLEGWRLFPIDKGFSLVIVPSKPSVTFWERFFSGFHLLCYFIQIIRLVNKAQFRSLSSVFQCPLRMFSP
ncbi:MAG: hypothetical protein U5L09_07535, partial [Bacteroidales bacterium]|nr:hypothetical protein [Bacteroidales bacterium]